ncbi:Hypp2705 [Branchiostoma lanceolatum]|uniref:Hypp2705 protein n=1 Tax=Branchiostoma lanceolatum TaxID=7740 RepID=A0A8J9ZTS3_BRALA|nr:Hypp2705 [Branchiostoma lanceolatum]
MPLCNDILQWQCTAFNLNSSTATLEIPGNPISATDDSNLQAITAEPKTYTYEGDTAELIFYMTVQSDLPSDGLNERTVWSSADRQNYCEMYQGETKCHGDRFSNGAEMWETWFPELDGGHTRHGRIVLLLRNVSLSDTGRYEGEIKTTDDINNVNTMLVVKEASERPSDEDTAKQGGTSMWWEWLGVLVYGAGVVSGLIFAFIGVKVSRHRKDSQKPSSVPV